LGLYGIVTGGSAPRHIVYVLDVSKSMEPRLERAKRELREALNGLRPQESFNIIAFYGKARVFNKRLLPATPGAIAQGISFIDHLQLDYGTNLERAMTRALAMNDVNVVCVITDGVPTYGERNFTKLARRIRQINVTNARIFTIGLVGENPDGSDQSFEATGLLREIAQQNNGEFRLVANADSIP
jgi:Ca-activated chloride channel family protein